MKKNQLSIAERERRLRQQPVRFTDMPCDEFDHCRVCGKPLSPQGELLVCECGRLWTKDGILRVLELPKNPYIPKNQRGNQTAKAPPKSTH